MKRARVAVIAAAVLAVATVAFAQKPDFSGTWTLDPEASGAPPAGTGGGGGGGGQRGGGGPMTVKQTADTLTVETQGRGGAQSRVYKLDGSESEITMGQMTAKASAKWDGNKLVITTKTEQGENVATWSLAGGVLTIESTGGRGPSKRVYKKST
jgi:hypothetical protein